MIYVYIYNLITNLDNHTKIPEFYQITKKDPVYILLHIFLKLLSK